MLIIQIRCDKCSHYLATSTLPGFGTKDIFKVNTTVSCQVPREILLTAQEAHRLFKQENDNMGQVARNKTWPLIWFCLSTVTFFGFCHGKSLWKTHHLGNMLFTSFRLRKSKATDFHGRQHHHYITIVVVFFEDLCKSFSPNKPPTGIIQEIYLLPGNLT